MRTFTMGALASGEPRGLLSSTAILSHLVNIG